MKKKKKSGCSSPVCTVPPLGASISLLECCYFYAVWVIFLALVIFLLITKHLPWIFCLFICSFISLLPTCVCKVARLIDASNCG